jgi:hypothetical protein
MWALKGAMGNVSHIGTSGQSGEIALVRLAGYVHLTGAWWGNVSERIVGIICSFALRPALDAVNFESYVSDANSRRLAGDIL